MDSFPFVKEAGPSAIQGFTLTTDTPGVAKTSAESTLTGLVPGTYDFDEDLPAGWTLTGVSCTGTGLSGSVLDGVAGTGRITVAAKSSGTCIFTNRKNGSLKVVKATVGKGGSTEFNFGISSPANPTSFSLKSGEHRLFPSLPPGEYTLAELNLPTGWSVQGIDCNGEKTEEDKVTVTLDPGESIVCTFTNFKEKDDKMEDVTKLFIHRRVDNLLTHGPDRARLLRRLEEQHEQPGSLKDYEPLKLVGSMLAGLVGSRAVEEPEIGPGGTGMIGSGRFGDLEPEADSSFTNSRVGGFGSAAFSQLGRGGSDFSLPAFKFSTSLSELRMAMQAVEASKEEEKARVMGELGLGGQPYTRPITGARPGLDIWVEGQMSRYDDSTGGIRREGDFKILYVGADYALSPRVLVGTLVQFDLTNEDVKDPDLTGSVDGRGWMAGPYIGIKLTDHLIFDARGAWGTSDNDIELYDDAAGWRKGSFDTTRWLATGSLTGNWYHGSWRITPQVGVAYGHEEYDTYKNDLGQTVDGASVSIGRATFATEVGYRIMTRDGTLIEPHLGITGIWNFDSDDLVVNGAVVDSSESRAKLDGGIMVRRPGGMGMRAAVSYDGIGESEFEAWSGQLWLNFPLN